MHKYILAATAHLGDSAEDARSEVYRSIHKKKKWMAEGAFDKVLSVTEKESKRIHYGKLGWNYDVHEEQG